LASRISSKEVPVCRGGNVAEKISKKGWKNFIKEEKSKALYFTVENKCFPIVGLNGLANKRRLYLRHTFLCNMDGSGTIIVSTE
jgi:hypothetical protein